MDQNEVPIEKKPSIVLGSTFENINLDSFRDLFKRVPVIKLKRIVLKERIKNEVVLMRCTETSGPQFPETEVSVLVEAALNGEVKPEDVIFCSNEIDAEAEVSLPCPDSYFLRARETNSNKRNEAESTEDSESEDDISTDSEYEPEEDSEVEEAEDVEEEESEEVNRPKENGSIRQDMMQEILRRVPVIKLTRIPFVSELDPIVKKEIKTEVFGNIENSRNPLENVIIQQPEASSNSPENLQNGSDNENYEVQVLKSSKRICYKPKYRKQLSIPRIPEPYREKAKSASSRSVEAPHEKESGNDVEEMVDKKPILQETYKCFKCDKELSTFKLLKKHLSFIHKARMLTKCTICGKILARPDRLKPHMKIHDEIREKPAKCKHCNNSYLTYKLLDLHILRMHTKEKEFLCPECGSIFWNELGYKRHLKGHENFRNNAISCTICKKKFKTKDRLKTHMEIHNEDKVKKFKCSECDKAYFTSGNLSLHKKLHHSGIQYSCEKEGCSQIFKSKRTLENHLMIHKGVIQKCLFCPKSYNKKGSLERHIRNHHPDKIEKEFKCTFEGCKISLASQVNLEKHLKRHEDPERKFMCEECGYCAKSMDHLKSHLGIHKSERNFKCDVDGCKKDYKHLANLSQHKKFYHDMTAEERREYFKKQRTLKKKGPQKEAPDSEEESFSESD